MDFIEGIHKKARSLKRHLLFPEGSEERTLRATEVILREDIAQELTLVGSAEHINKKTKELKLNFSPFILDRLHIVDPKDPAQEGRRAQYARLYYELRKHRGMTEEAAYAECADPLRFGFLMLKNKAVDAVVAGAENSTANVLRAAFSIIKTAPGIKLVSSCFLMILSDSQWGSDGRMIFSDCGIVPNPSVEDLAHIALAAAKSCRQFLNVEPVLAMLSYSTKGSSRSDDTERVRQATELVRELEPSLCVDGEMQSDAALVPSVGERKAPGSQVAGRANTLIFPDLQSGNIGYKLVQRLAGAEAIGPILQGLNQPVSDLSRGASVDDIVNAAALTIIQSDIS